MIFVLILSLVFAQTPAQTPAAPSASVDEKSQQIIDHAIEAQVEECKQFTLKVGLENLLRGWWKKEGGKVTYAGRREAGLAKRNETIRLTFPDGYWVEYEFGAKENLPSKIIY